MNTYIYIYIVLIGTRQVSLGFGDWLSKKNISSYAMYNSNDNYNNTKWVTFISQNMREISLTNQLNISIYLCTNILSY